MSLFIQGAKLPTVEGDKSIKAEIRCIGGKWEFGIMTGGYHCCQEWTFYPLSELPKHGRLIDALWVRNQIIKQWMDYSDDSHMYKRGMEDAYEVIRNAPTIIPASEEGET